MAKALSDKKPLSDKERALIDAYWRAANYLSVGQIYLYDNPLLKQIPDQGSHQATSPGPLGNNTGSELHLRSSEPGDQEARPGHDLHHRPRAWRARYSSRMPTSREPTAKSIRTFRATKQGMKRLFTQFSFPGGIPSHVAPETPGSIHEGGELGYAFSHAYGAAFDNPDLIVACVVGDGEAETGPLATSWHSNKFLNPVTDGVVLPILHLNGYKIANPCILARISHEELDQLFRGYGYTPHFVEGHEPEAMHELMAATLDNVCRRDSAHQGRRAFERFHRAAPLADDRTSHTQGLDVPEGDRRQAHRGLLALAPGANGRDAREPGARAHPRRVDEELPTRGSVRRQRAPPARAGRACPARHPPHERQSAHQWRLAPARSAAPGFPRLRCRSERRPVPSRPKSTRVMGKFLRDVMKLNMEAQNFRLFSPDENNSNRWQDVLEVTNRAWVAETLSLGRSPRARRAGDGDAQRAPVPGLAGRLSPDRPARLLLLLRGVHPHHRLDVQPARQVAEGVQSHSRGGGPSPRSTTCCRSHVWRQDHNGFSHQDPGFIDHVVNKKAEVVRVYLPPDANCLLSVTDHCLRSRNYVNVVVAGKQPAPQWLTMDEAIKHCTAGLGIWEWASNDRGSEPDVVMACCGDVPTLETLAAVDLLRRHAPELKVRVINVVEPHEAAAAERAPARPLGPRLRRAVHHGQADHLRLPRLPVAHPPADLPANGPRQPPRARLQGGGHHDHAVRHVRAERSRPLPPGERRDRPRAEARCAGRLRQAGDPRQAHRAQAVHRRHGDDMPEITGWRWGQEAASAGVRSTEADNV